MPLVQDRSLSLLTGSPACYHCTVDTCRQRLVILECTVCSRKYSEIQDCMPEDVMAMPGPGVDLFVFAAQSAIPFLAAECGKYAAHAIT